MLILLLTLNLIPFILQSDIVINALCPNEHFWTEWHHINETFSNETNIFINLTMDSTISRRYADCFPPIDIELNPMMKIEDFFIGFTSLNDLNWKYFSTAKIKKNDFNVRLCCANRIKHNSSPIPTKIHDESNESINETKTKRQTRKQTVVDPKKLLSIDGEECGIIKWTRKSNRARRIIGGFESKPHSWPWMAVFDQRLKPMEFNGRYWLCGATIIGRRYVLTASGCLNTTGGMFRNVIAGIHDRETLDERDGEQIRSVVEYHIHPVFVHTRRRDFNIALLRVDPPFIFNDYVQPACLPIRNLESFDDVIVMGWGQDGFIPKLVTSLKQYHAYVEPDCTLHAWKNFDKDRLICVKDGSSTSISCPGDAGGPLLHAQNNQYTVVGINSYHSNCNSSEDLKNPIGFTSVFTYMKWISSLIEPENMLNVAKVVD